MKEPDYKSLFIETLMRCQLCFPRTEQEDIWFENGHDTNTKDGVDFFKRVNEALDKTTKG